MINADDMGGDGVSDGPGGLHREHPPDSGVCKCCKDQGGY